MTMTQRFLILPVAIALWAGPAGAQDAPPAEPSFEELKAEYDEVYRSYYRKYIAARRAEADEAELAEIEKTDPSIQFIPRFVAGAEKYAGTEAAFDYASWLFIHAGTRDPQASEQALEQLLRDHIDDAKMGDIARSVGISARTGRIERSKALKVEDQIAEASGDPQVRAMALYWRCYAVKVTGPSAAEIERAVADLEKAIESADPQLKKQAEGMLFELTSLSVGKVAPDIEGEDLDGVVFKLSDYRGKVVLLDFWGDW